MQRRMSRTMGMLAFSICATPAVAGGFLLQIELPDRSNPAMKDALVVVKPVGCHGPGSAVTATAEGLVHGQRRTIEVKLEKLPHNPNDVYETYTVKRQWPTQGTWLLVVTADNPITVNGKSQPMSTSAIMEFDSTGRPRMTGGVQPRQLSVKHFAGKVKAGEIDKALSATAGNRGGQSATL